MKTNTILYIVSDVRSGSTVLENILSKSKDIISLGELHLLDSHIHKGKWGATWNWNCSCGKSFTTCEFWLSVYKELGIKSAQEITKTQLSEGYYNRKDDISQHNEAIQILNKIYQAVFKLSNCKVIIDSSKSPFQGVELYKNRENIFKFIHLKRDVRAVTISKNKWSIKFFNKPLNLYKVLINTFRYRAQSNSALKNVKEEDIFTIGYEEFFENPQHHLNKIADFVGFQRIEMPEYMVLQNDHTIAGTPNRFEKRKIKLDENWKESARKNPIFNALGYILNKLA